MTRWDCDVKIWRGVPCSFPAFHGWPVSRFRNDDIVSSSTASLRYICCSVCYNWVPESSRYHKCRVIHSPKQDDSKIPVTEFESVQKEGPVQDCVYVVAKDEYNKCYLCNDRVLLQFLPGIEEWVYMDCVEHEGVPVHSFCRDIAYPTTPVSPQQESKISAEFESVQEKDPVKEECVYLLVTDEHEKNHHGKCHLCNDRMHLQILHDIEEWVYMDCVEHEGIPVHKDCRDVVYG